jgi:hypothetical protein
MAGEDAATTAVDRFQDRLPASLYEIAWQYSLLDWFASAESDDIDWELAPGHLAYLTPREKDGLFGADDSLIIVYADLSDPENPTLRDNTLGGPIDITTYTERDRFRVGHSYPPGKSSSMTDYSITTHKNASAHHIAGLRDDAWGTNNVQDRFTDWAQSEFAAQVREDASSADAALLDGLTALGDDEASMNELTEQLLGLAEDEDQEFDALITVAVRQPGSEEYKLPGEIGVLNDVMQAKKATRLENISVEDASGEGVGYVTGAETLVTGGSAGLFGMYANKQREHVPNLDPEGTDAWRLRPLDFDVAAALDLASSVFGEFSRGLGSSRRLFVLPYLATRKRDLDPATFRWFYDHVYHPIQSAEAGADGDFDEILNSALLESARLANPSVESPDAEDLLFGEVDDTAWESVRFAVVLQITGNPNRVFFDTLDGLAPAAELNNAHNEVTASPYFEGEGIFADSPNPENSPLLGRSLELARTILYGYYFERTTEPTRTSRESSDRPDAGAIDDSRMQRVRNLVTGTRIDARDLFEQYVHQLVQNQRKEFGSDDDYIPFPKRSVVEQYVQFRALGHTGALDTSEMIALDTPMTENPDTRVEFDSRTDRLDAFIDSHAALDGEAEQAIFTLGGLVGRISATQSHPQNDISSTLIRRYPVDYVTAQTIKEVTNEVLQMNNSYAEAFDEWSYATNSRYYERLTDTMLAADPSTWRFSESELQWLYSLGIAYGLSDSSIESDEDGNDPADDPATDTEAPSEIQ